MVAPHAVYHVEVKGYRGEIRGNAHQWTFENGAVQPSPIPLANKKTKILAGRLKRAGRLDGVFVDTMILLTDDNARPRLKDDQAGRVVRLADAADYLSDPKRLPVSTDDITRLHNPICEALFGTARPGKKVQRIGLYDVRTPFGSSASIPI